MLNVVNISKKDKVGRRFNNYDIRDKLVEFGINSSFICWQETDQDSYAVSASNKIMRFFTNAIAKLGRYTGNLNGYHSNSSAIKQLPYYQQSNLIHFHIVHEEFLSVKDWLNLAEDKPVVWTWHDPFMMNGHCIYSLGCDGFETGCKSCPHLDYHFPIRIDRSGNNLEEKKNALKLIDPLVIVSSQYMKDLIDRSVYKDFLRVKLLPFGIEHTQSITQEAAKNNLNIPDGNVVVGFRAVYSDYKGIGLIKRALSDFARKHPNFNLTIIYFQEQNFLSDISSKFQIIQPGWIEGSEIHKYYAAMDFFLMPSRAEAFGLMAVEALLSGALPLVTSGSALEDIVNAPVYGLSSLHEADEYSWMVEKTILNAGYYSTKRGDRREYAIKRYNINDFCQKLANIYNEEYEYHISNRRSARY